MKGCKLKMLMIRAIIRPERVREVLSELLESGFAAVTKMDVMGRGRQRGLQFGDVFYDEIPKEMLLMVVKEEDKDDILEIVMKKARTGEKGAFGDGKIFITPVNEAFTISSGVAQL
jgi:nitrogen regulatory protein PII 1